MLLVETGSVERYLQHGMTVLLIASYTDSRDPVGGHISSRYGRCALAVPGRCVGSVPAIGEVEAGAAIMAIVTGPA